MTAIHHDSTHGRCPQSAEIALAPNDHPDHLEPTANNPYPSALLFRGRLIHLFSQRDPRYVDWASAGAVFVMESTGKMTTRETASVHITHGGAKKVLISAPSKDVPNVVFGVNHGTYTGSDDILSNASCTVRHLLVLAPLYNMETQADLCITRQTASHPSPRSCTRHSESRRA